MNKTKMMKVMMASTVLFAAACSGTASEQPSATSETKTYKVAVVKQLDHPSLDEIANAITAEFDAISARDGVTIEYGEVYSGQNDQTTLQQIASKALSDSVDCIVPIATLAAQTMTAACEDTQTPVVFAAISDPETAGLTDIPYVTGTSDALNTAQIFDMMFAANADVKKVGLLYSKSEANSTTAIQEAKAILDAKGIEYVEGVGNTNDEILQAAGALIAGGVDAVFTPTDNVVMAAELAVAQLFVEAGIPHYTGADSFVTCGGFVTCGVDYTALGKQTADMAYEAMKGSIGSYEVVPGGIITVNTETAEALGMDISVFDSFGEVVKVTTGQE